MKPRKIFSVVAVSGALIAQAPASFADDLIGAPKQQGPRERHPGSASAPDAGASLRQGVVTAVNPERGQIEIQGRWHRIDSGRTRFFRSGYAANIDAVAKGQTLKFTVAATQGEQPTLGVVYVP
ncbi:MAG: hypothetical protein WA210_07320 [Burkholderiaceae bacterium]